MDYSKEILFTLPGRIGDNLLRWPAVFHFWRKTGCQVVVGLDQESYSILEPLLCEQPPVKRIIQFSGIDLETGPGGQPWDLGFKTTDYDIWSSVFHLGFRTHPIRNIIQSSCEQLDLDLSTEELQFPSLAFEHRPRRSRCVLHGTLPGYKHNRDLYWSFLGQCRTQLEEKFNELCFIGNEAERGYARTLGYPTVVTNSFKEASELLSEAQAVVAGPSSVAALAGLMQIPCLRVHDNNPNAPAETWANLGAFQMNYLPWQTPPREALEKFIDILNHQHNFDLCVGA